MFQEAFDNSHISMIILAIKMPLAMGNDSWLRAFLLFLLILSDDTIKQFQCEILQLLKRDDQTDAGRI